MRRAIVAVAVLAAMVGVADAAEKCTLGDGGLIKIESWSFQPSAEKPTNLAIVTTNKINKPIRMIDANFSFFDALGGSVGIIPINRDQDFKAEDRREFTIPWADNEWLVPRLPRLKPNEGTAVVCVMGAVYDDGDSAKIRK